MESNRPTEGPGGSQDLRDSATQTEEATLLLQASDAPIATSSPSIRSCRTSTSITAAAGVEASNLEAKTRMNPRRIHPSHPTPPSNGIENLNPSRNPYHSPQRSSVTTAPNHAPLLTNLSHSPPSSPLASFPLAPTSLSSTTALYYNSNPTIQTAVQNALTHYKNQISQSTSLEKTYTADQLRHVLQTERHRTKSLIAELAAYKSMAVVTQAEAEMVEEGRINCLMRKLDGVVKEKGRIVLELEREEEMLTNTLQKKLNQVRKEKAMLQEQIQKEHEFNLELNAKLDQSQGNSNVSIHEDEEGKDGQNGNKTNPRNSLLQGRGSNSSAVDRLTSRFQSTLEPFHDE